MVEMDDEILDILFVAEDEGLAEMYKLKLELDGYRVRVVSRRQTRSIVPPLPSLVFLDPRQSTARPPRFLSDLRSNSLTEDLPVVVLTAYREEELRKRGVRLGARDYLVRVPSPQADAGPTRTEPRRANSDWATIETANESAAGQTRTIGPAEYARFPGDVDHEYGAAHSTTATLVMEFRLAARLRAPGRPHPA